MINYVEKKESFCSNMKSLFLSYAWVLSIFAWNTKRVETNLTTYFLNYFGYIKCSAIYKIRHLQIFFKIDVFKYLQYSQDNNGPEGL